MSLLNPLCAFAKQPASVRTSFHLLSFISYLLHNAISALHSFACPDSLVCLHLFCTAVHVCICSLICIMRYLCLFALLRTRLAVCSVLASCACDSFLFVCPFPILHTCTSYSTCQHMYWHAYAGNCKYYRCYLLLLVVYASGVAHTTVCLASLPRCMHVLTAKMWFASVKTAYLSKALKVTPKVTAGKVA